ARRPRVVGCPRGCRSGRGQRAAVDAGDLEGLARDGAHERLRRDAASGSDRLGRLRIRRRARRSARVRGEAPAELRRSMSEAAPGFPDLEQVATQERSRLAEAVRRAIDVVMTVENATVEQMIAAAESFETATALLAGPRAT